MRVKIPTRTEPRTLTLKISLTSKVQSSELLHRLLWEGGSAALATPEIQLRMTNFRKFPAVNANRQTGESTPRNSASVGVGE